MIKKHINYSINQFYRIKFKFVRFLFVGCYIHFFFVPCLLDFDIIWCALFNAVFISNSLGILFNYKTIGNLVFESVSNKLILIFFAVYLFIYFLCIIGLKLLFFVGVDKYWGAVIIAALMAVIAFF